MFFNEFQEIFEFLKISILNPPFLFCIFELSLICLIGGAQRGMPDDRRHLAAGHVPDRRAPEHIDQSGRRLRHLPRGKVRQFSVYSTRA